VRGTQRRGDRRRQQLLEAAHTLISRLELPQVTYAAVCAQAGVPPSSAHHFYPDLDALFRALLEAHRDEHDAALMRPLRARDRRSWQAVMECLIERAARYYRAHPVEAKLALSGQTPAQLKRADRDADRTLARRMLQVLEDLFTVPRIPDRESMAYAAIQLVDLMFTLSVAESGRITPTWIEYAKKAAIGFLTQYFGERLEPRPPAPRTR
jgi:AcrR family transcriptional regulator